ncbi:5-(carboxyamino)imidazole ribonucleotide synthase [Corynebacterium sp. MSK006]|uniref:5-(carboxyamino)imidazole ribonucleotide synthase n=1 Tax=Corynebacterium sp. MSK006 TaxID=3050187 RepID=UPI00254AA9FE|nr:5-(carboxyamino)imidazole ribonucleotide synthase [Corynebacterium sp. MSK006]MDK8896020.1 5-(carboxyamino)imidazole ribonucleotide synthase [Corynebacterium sp. MSK006]
MSTVTDSGNPHAHAPGTPTVAVIGDGQLARMMQTAAIELGQSVRLLAGAPDASAAQVAADCVQGDYHELADLERAVEGADAVTFDHEHVPNRHLRTLLDRGVVVEPRPEALIFAQDKLEQRRRLHELGLPVPPFAAIESIDDAVEFFERVDGAVCLKATRGGYDGHGVWFPGDLEDLKKLAEKLLGDEVPLMAEEKVPFTRELSAMVARNRSGECVAWPVVESVQADGICHEAVAPAPGLPVDIERGTRTLAETIARELDVTGVLAVELFEAEGPEGAPRVVVNELAMRPHNTGHWTQDGCVTSQFEQHLRAVLNMPLGSTELVTPHTVMVNTLGADESPEMPLTERVNAVWRRFPHAKIHLYGKSHRPGRKLGHVNVTGSDLGAVRREAQLAAHFLVHAVWADGYREA